MKISFHGAAGCVTGSCYLVEAADSKFLVDCGMFQGNKTLKENNYKEFAFDPASIDFVLVTHAHIDHTGLLPKLVKKGFHGLIYATLPTVDLLKYLLPDSARIQEVEVFQLNKRNERKGIPPVTPIYDEIDADNTIGLLRGIERYRAFAPAKNIDVTFHNAGHVLGSSFIEINIKEGNETRKIVFSGDLGEDDHPIINDPDRIKAMDFLLIESTYGDRNRDIVTKEQRLDKIAEVFADAEKRGGKIIIPTFSLERTQDLLHDILILKKKNKISRIPVYVDSPLAKEITQVFLKYPDMYDEDATRVMKQMGGLFDHPDFHFTNSVDESKLLNEKDNIVIMSASGMCDAGRIKHHLKHNLWDPKNTVVFVGYQAEGTLGRLISEGAKKVRIFGEEINVGAKIESIYGYSGHADQNGLMKWLKAVEEEPRNIFVTHGEPEASEALVKLIKEERGFKAIAPKMGEEYDLLQFVKVGDVELNKKREKVKYVLVRSSAPAYSSLTRDSHNLKAELLIKINELMENCKDESERCAKLQNLLNLL